LGNPYQRLKTLFFKEKRGNARAPFFRQVTS
jgi:hypothetical protein